MTDEAPKPVAKLTGAEIQERNRIKEEKKRNRRNAVRARNNDLLLQFVLGIADMSLTSPKGVNEGKYYADRLRQLRSAAREYVNTFDSMQRADDKREAAQ